MKCKILKTRFVSTANILESELPNSGMVNPLTPNDLYSGRTAPLNSKRCILYIY